MKTYCEVMKYFKIKSSSEILFTNIQENSKKVNKNSIFVALGKGNNYITEAKKNGARLIISDKEYPFLKDNLMDFYLWFYDYPNFDIELIGITGTNGKTTTSFFLHQLLKKSLLISNVPGRNNIYLTVNTTPSSLEIVHALLKAKESKLRYVIMEVSSIGIKENRVKGLLFNVIGLTNLTSDHLDYHHTLEEYQQTKIDFINSQVSKLYIGELSEELITKLSRPYFKVSKISIQKPNNLSSFNIYNLSLAYQIASSYINVRKLNYRLKRVKLPKGRSQLIHKKPRVIIDYAHTEAAFLAILSEEKKKCKGKLLVLFGAGGNRDKGKRYKYGELVYKYANVGLVCNDNPRYESPSEIIDDIIEVNPSFFIVEQDRKRAINQILKMAKKEDTVLILGRGHEKIQQINHLEIYLSDEDEVKKWIKE